MDNLVGVGKDKNNYVRWRYTKQVPHQLLLMIPGTDEAIISPELPSVKNKLIENFAPLRVSIHHLVIINHKGCTIHE
jgi:hypothetical protein